jgi:ParB-like chromosome segregation protein Spo0J
VSRDRVKRLAEEMKVKNLLHLYPIVIDQDGVILDGQHRFEAAKSIESEIYYVQSENDYQISDVSQSNSMQSVDFV